MMGLKGAAIRLKVFLAVPGALRPFVVLTRSNASVAPIYCHDRQLCVNSRRASLKKARIGRDLTSTKASVSFELALTHKGEESCGSYT